MQTVKSKMVTSAFNGTDDFLASKKLINLVDGETLKFKEKCMKSKATTTIKDVQSKIRKTEIRIYSKKGDSPLNE